MRPRRSKAKVSTAGAPVRRPHLRWFALLAFLVCLGYANSLDAGLIFDNRALIVDDARLHAVSFENLKLIFTTNYWWPKPSTDYRPFTLLTYLYNYAVLGSGTDPVSYHLVNLLLHCLNAALIYLLMLALWSAPLEAFLAAALFAVHPVATEAVTNVVGRADLLATASVLGGLLVYLQVIRTPSRRWPWLGALAAVGAIGAFSKESATALPAVLILYDLTWRLDPLSSNRWANLGANIWLRFRQGYWAAVAPFALFWGVRTAVFAGLPKLPAPFLENPLALADFWTSRATAVKVLGKYLGLMVWPATLSCDYSYNEIPLFAWGGRGWQDWMALVSLAAVAGLAALAVWAYRRRKDLFFFMAFFVVTLAPVANLAFHIGTIMAERLLYLPSAVFGGFVVVMVRMGATRFRTADGRRLALAALGILIAAGCVRTIVRNRDWGNAERAFLRGTETSPGSYKMHSGAALALSEADATRNMDRILAEYEAAQHILRGIPPENLDLNMLVHLGAYYQWRGDRLAGRDAEGNILPSPASQPWYEKSAQVLLDAAESLRRLGRRQMNSSRAADRAWLPTNPKIFTTLADTRIRQRRYEDARGALENAVRVMPGRADLYVRAANLDFATARPEEGVTALHAALILDPDDAGTLSTLAGIYRKVDPQSCAATADLREVRPQCAPVRQFRCAAYATLIGLLGRNAARISQLRADAAAAGCTPGAQ